MSGKTRYLTKSRFKIGCECPTKLFFSGKAQYGSNKDDNKFLESLAEGGFQVGALAQVYHEGGVAIDTLNSEEALQRTEELLKQENIILYEPAFRSGDLLIRVDILIKRGDSVEVVEVKAKSFDPTEDDTFYTKTSIKKGKPEIKSKWEPYLLDIAFQTYVVRRAFPNWNVTCALMLANKNTIASVESLNQRFFLKRGLNDRVAVEVAPGTTRDSLGNPVLVKVGVDSEVKLLLSASVDGQSFEERIELLAAAYVGDRMVVPPIGGRCKSCEFRIDQRMKEGGLKSGFEQCWTTAAKVSGKDFQRQMIFDLWNFRKSAQLIEEGRYFIDEVTEDDIKPQPKENESGLSASERQWLQVEKVKNRDDSPFLDKSGLSAEMKSWKFPLHFIDFETTMVAIPFHKGMRPYELTAFQFSHHLVNADGKVEHRNEYINRKHGQFPNFEFLRELKAALSTDDGTIFRYAPHENTVLNMIHGQLAKSSEPDRVELMTWIRSITKATEDSVDQWEGPRNMVDMWDLVKRYFYHPATQGSNSIKDVLPAILGSSSYLQARYGKPIYGSPDGIPSFNYKDWQWIRKDPDGKLYDPYKLLPPIFDDVDLERADSFITEGNIAEGGAAMTAYARMQFTQMSELERDRVCSALLKYCELDTLAMVMIYEYWKKMIEDARS